MHGTLKLHLEVLPLLQDSSANTDRTLSFAICVGRFIGRKLLPRRFRGLPIRISKHNLEVIAT